LQEELVRTNPDEPLFGGDLAVILITVGDGRARAGRTAEARDCAERAQALLNRLAALDPAPASLRRQLGRGFHTLGLLLSSLGLPVEALRSVTVARDLEEKLLQEHPGSPAFMGNLADTCAELGRLQQGLGQSAEALRSYERLCDLGEKLFLKHSYGAKERSKLGRAWGQCGKILRQQGRLEEARRALERALPHLRLAADQAPEVDAYRDQLSQHSSLLTSVLRELGRPAEAAAQKSPRG
jgi:tetratricopeptide (TPR) repeat protein